jgi:hypothetical protein
MAVPHILVSVVAGGQAPGLGIRGEASVGVAAAQLKQLRQRKPVVLGQPVS